jgi:hypothetical protein
VVVVAIVAGAAALLLAHLLEALLALLAEVGELGLGLLALLAQERAQLLLLVPAAAAPGTTGAPRHAAAEAALGAQVLVGLHLALKQPLRLLPL